MGLPSGTTEGRGEGKQGAGGGGLLIRPTGEKNGKWMTAMTTNLRRKVLRAETGPACVEAGRLTAELKQLQVEQGYNLGKEAQWAARTHNPRLMESLTGRPMGMVAWAGCSGQQHPGHGLQFPMPAGFSSLQGQKGLL